MEEEEVMTGGLFEDMFSNPIITFAFQLVIAIVVTIALIIASKVIASIIKNRVIQNTALFEDDEVYSERVGHLISNMVFYPLLLISLFVGFQIIGFDIGLLLGGLSVGLGFAFREILGNMFAGVMLLLTKEIKLGDKIELEKEVGKSYLGIIEEITIRYTVIRGLTDKRRVIVPNLDMINYPVKTYNAEEAVKFYSFVLIHYNEDVNKAIEVIKSALNESDLIVHKDDTKVLINKIGDSSGDKVNSINTSNGVELRIIYHIDPNVFTEPPKIVEGKVNQIIYKAIKENNIQIAYPHSSVTVDKNDKNLLGSALYLMKNNKK